MKKIMLSLMALSLIAVSCKNEESKTETKDSATTTAKTETPAKKMTPEEEQKAWMEYATPGAMHQWMAKANGTWDGDMTVWMNPDSPSMKTKGVAVYKMILGGRYQEGVHTGNMMGQQFEGRSMMAYDNQTKKFYSSWIDNMGTGVMNLVGTYDEASKTLTSTGKMVDPSTGGEVDVREVVTMIDDNNQKMEMYCTKNGKEMKTMEMMAKKRK